MSGSFTGISGRSLAVAAAIAHHVDDQGGPIQE
jgi:hypothetical protein